MNNNIARSAMMVMLMLVGILSARSDVHAERILPPDGVFYYQPAASVYGLEATWINPAGLGRYNGSGYQLMADYADDDIARSWGTVGGNRSLSFAYRNLDLPAGEDFKEYIVATGMPIGQKMFLGGSYRSIKEGPAVYHKRHYWNIGLIEQHGGPLSWGAVFSNLNRGRVDGEQSETEMRFSASYRPADYKITISADMFLSTGTRMSNADYVYHAEYIPRPGLYISGYVTSDEEYQIGLRTNLLQYFTGSKTNISSGGDHVRTNIFVGATSLRQPSLIPEKRRRLSMSISGRIRENPPQPRWGRKSTPFVKLILSIYRAAEDKSISELILSLNRTRLGIAQAQELRTALGYFRAAGKHVDCHLSYPGNLAYYIGSVADRIFIPPVSQLNLTGLAAELTFYAGTLDKLGVKADLVRIGKYKTAAESFTEKAGSDENREQINRILDELYLQFVSTIATGRGITDDSMVTVVDNGPYTSAEALEYGLIDGLSYRDNLKKDFLSGRPEVSFRRYNEEASSGNDWPARPVLAVVVVDGEIAANETPSGPFDRSNRATPSLMRKAFQDAVGKRNVKGIVLRINSPGGLALAGEEILHQAERAVEKKPVAVSMGNVAASGGYQIATAAERLLASPATITGSIGIVGGKIDLSELYRKIDLGKELYTRGRFAGMLSTTRPFSDEERQKYFSQMSAMYDHFVKIVADNRSLSVDSVDALARGRVWTGKEAMENGLVDELGGIKESLDYMAERVGIDEYVVELFPRKRPLFILPGQSYLGSLVSIFTGTENIATNLTRGSVLSADEGMFTRMPYDIEIK